MYVPQRLIITGISQLVGVVAVVILLCAIIKSSGGTLMSWHPMLMVLSMVYMMGTSLTIYRGLPWLRKYNLKLLHGGIHIFALAFASAGFGIMVYVVQDKPYFRHFASLHSLFGLIAFILFILQYIAGFLIYLYPQASLSTKMAAMPIHVVIGILIFAMSVITAMIGISGHTSNSAKPRSEIPVLYTFAGFLVFLFAALVFYLLVRSSFRREPLPED